MKRILSFLLTAFLLLSLTGCGGTEDTGGAGSSSSADIVSQEEPGPVDVPFALAAYPAYSFHPVLAENRANLTLSPLLYEPLFQVDGSFQAVPVLCQSYAVSEDKLVWTFTLRSGVTFSDGTPLTGEAAAAALNTARAPGARYVQRLAAVSSITGSEDTVTVSLGRPHGNLPLLLDIPIALDNGERPAGTGPYVLQEEESGGLALSSRSGWWQGKTLPARSIPLTSVSKSDDLIASFAAGNIGLVDVDLMGTNALGYSGSYETWDYATTDLLYLGFNTQRGLCRDAGVRRVLSLAADRTSITQIDYASHAQAALLPTHPAGPLYDAALIQDQGFDPEGLAAGVETLKLSGKALTLLVNSENTSKLAAARRIANQLTSAGLEIQLESLDFERCQAALAAGQFDLYLGEVMLTADFDLSALLGPAGALNYGGWQHGEAAALLDALLQADGSARPAAARDLYTLLLEEVPIVPLCFKNGSVLTQWGRLTGPSPVRNNVFYQLENWTIK